MAVCKWDCGYVCRLNQKSVEWHGRGLRAVRPAAAASVSGSSCTRARFRHRWSSVCAVTKTGPELLSAWISRQVRSCGKVLSPVNIQFLLSSQASAWHPQDKPPPALCSFLFLNLHFLPSLPQPLSARTPFSHFDAFKCHQQASPSPYYWLVHRKFASEDCRNLVMSLPKHLDATDRGGTFVFRGLVCSGRCCWFESRQCCSTAGLCYRWNNKKNAF